MFKEIEGTNGIYKANEYGDIYSEFTKKILKPQKTNGYCCVVLRIHGNVKRLLVHRLVATLFIPNHENKPEINHKDGNKENNSVKNLEWVTSSENHKHAYDVLGRTNGMLNFTGFNNAKSKRVKQLTLDENVIKIFGSVREAANALSLNPSHISKVCRGKLNMHGGFKWSY